MTFVLANTAKEEAACLSFCWDVRCANNVLLNKRVLYVAEYLSTNWSCWSQRHECLLNAAAQQLSRANTEHGGGAKKTLAGAVAMMRELGSSGLALIAGGRAEDGEESPDYLKVFPPPPQNTYTFRAPPSHQDGALLPLRVPLPRTLSAWAGCSSLKMIGWLQLV